MGGTEGDGGGGGFKGGEGVERDVGLRLEKNEGTLLVN